MTKYSVGLIMQHRGSFSLYFFICVMESTIATKLQGKQISKPKKPQPQNTPQSHKPSNPLAPRPNQPNIELIIYCLIVQA